MNYQNLSDKDLIRMCKKCGSELLRIKKEFGIMLIEVHKRGIVRQFGFTSIYHFAKIIGGLSESYVVEVLRIRRKIRGITKVEG